MEESTCLESSKEQKELQQSKFQIKMDELTYQGVLVLCDNSIKITLTLGLSEFKWCQKYSFEELCKLNEFFGAFKTLEKSYEYLKSVFNQKSLKLKRDDEQKIILSITEELSTIPLSYEICLYQKQISTTDALRSLNNSILDIQNEMNQLRTSLESKDQNMKQYDEVVNTLKNENNKLKSEMQNEMKQLKTNLESKDQKMKEQDEVVNNLKNENIQLKSDIKSIQEENQKQINEIQKSLFPKFRQPMFSQIICQKDVDTLGQWIHEGKKQMELKLVYQATRDGFQTSKFYEKCSSIQPTLIIIETTNFKRFGGYTDLQWQNNSVAVPSNPNKSFIFSLDKNKKYPSDSPNCAQAIYGTTNYIAFGGTDLILYSDSNTTDSSNVACVTYGKNLGRTNYDFTGGNKTFLSNEIEVFQVILK